MGRNAKLEASIYDYQHPDNALNKRKNACQRVENRKKYTVTANFMAFFKKNVQNNLRDYGFMPIFAPKLWHYAQICRGKM